MLLVREDAYCKKQSLTYISYATSDWWPHKHSGPHITFTKHHWLPFRSRNYWKLWATVRWGLLASCKPRFTGVSVAGTTVYYYRSRGAWWQKLLWEIWQSWRSLNAKAQRHIHSAPRTVYERVTCGIADRWRAESMDMKQITAVWVYLCVRYWWFSEILMREHSYEKLYQSGLDVIAEILSESNSWFVDNKHVWRNG